MEYGVNNIFVHIVARIMRHIRQAYNSFFLKDLKSRMGFIAPSSIFHLPTICVCPKKVFLYEGTNIFGNSQFIISPKGETGRFIMMKHSGAAQGLTVITGNHTTLPRIGHWHKEQSISKDGDKDLDIVVQEDVWIGANVTLCAGVTIGRGAIVGAGSVVRKSIPPYSICMGNPAKVVAFKYTPSEILQHEKILYPEHERISEDILIANHQKYFLRRIKEIKAFVQ